jgi:hypothetical protein
MKIYTFGGVQKAKIGPPEPKNGILMKNNKTLYFYFEFLKNKIVLHS